MLIFAKVAERGSENGELSYATLHSAANSG